MTGCIRFEADDEKAVPIDSVEDLETTMSQCASHSIYVNTRANSSMVGIKVVIVFAGGLVAGALTLLSVIGDHSGGLRGRS